MGYETIGADAVNTLYFDGGLGEGLRTGRLKPRHLEAVVPKQLYELGVSPDFNKALDIYAGNGAPKDFREKLLDQGDSQIFLAAFSNIDTLSPEERGILGQIWYPVVEVSGDIRRRHYEDIVREQWNLGPDFNLNELDNDYVVNGGNAPGLLKIENYIGGSQIPAGYFGPLMVNGEYANGTYYPILTTHEGVLIKAANAGASFTKGVGGVDTMVTRDSMARGSMFETERIIDSKKAGEWIRSHFDDLQEVFRKREPFVKLTGIEVREAGSSLHVRYIAETGNAMGMNMVTQASHDTSKYIARECEYITDYTSVSGNTCADKKACQINVVQGRGKTVHAGIVLPASYIADIIGKRVGHDIDPDFAYKKIINAVVDKFYVGSALAGGAGGTQNSNVANIVAGIYNTYGQDAAQIVEGSSAITRINLTSTDEGEDALKFEQVYPTMEVGIIGGGASSRLANKLLKAIDCGDPRDPDSAKRFAEIAAASYLSGDLSTLIALATGVLAERHTDSTKTYKTSSDVI